MIFRRILLWYFLLIGNIYAESQEGSISYYRSGNTTASGETYDPNKLTVAHRELPFGTQVEFRHKGKTVVARVNDRGPKHRNRDFDVSLGTAKELGITQAGIARVTYEITNTNLRHNSLARQDVSRKNPRNNHRRKRAMGKGWGAKTYQVAHSVPKGNSGR